MSYASRVVDVARSNRIPGTVLSRLEVERRSLSANDQACGPEPGRDATTAVDTAIGHLLGSNAMPPESTARRSYQCDLPKASEQAGNEHSSDELDES
jgi:hypothetical protein